MKIEVSDKSIEWMRYRVVNFNGVEITCSSFDDITKDCIIPLMNKSGQIIQDGNHEPIYITVNLPMAKFEKISDIIVINAAPRICDKKTISYEEILDHACKNPGATVVISYRHTSNKKSRTLAKGESADVEDGMVIDCHYTSLA